MKNKLSDLRNHLFETIEKLKDGDLDVTKARTIADVAQVIINTAKVEVDFLKATDGRGSGFIEGEELAGTLERPRLVKR